MITSSATGTSTKAWEFVKNYYKTNALHPKNVVVVNERALQRACPKPQQEGAAQGRGRGRAARLGDVASTREKDADEMLAKNGMTRARARSAELKAALAQDRRQMAAEWQKTAGADGEAILKAYRGK